MDKKETQLCTAATILIFMIFLSAGCATAKKQTPAVSESKSAPKELAVTKEMSVAVPVVSAPQKPQSRFFDDVLTFTSLEEVDLDGDGLVEILAVYVSKSNVNSVKIIKLDAKREQGTVIFNRSFVSSLVKLSIKDNKPVLMVREVDSPSGRLINRFYQWDGKTFISE